MPKLIKPYMTPMQLLIYEVSSGLSYHTSWRPGQNSHSTSLREELVSPLDEKSQSFDQHVNHRALRKRNGGRVHANVRARVDMFSATVSIAINAIWVLYPPTK